MEIRAQVCFGDKDISRLLDDKGILDTPKNIELVSANANRQIHLVMQEAGEDMLEAMIDELKRDSKFDTIVEEDDDDDEYTSGLLQTTNGLVRTRNISEDYLTRSAAFAGYAAYLGMHAGKHIIVCKDYGVDRLFFLPVTREDCPVIGTARILNEEKDLHGLKHYVMVGFRYYFEYGYEDYKNSSKALICKRRYGRDELLAIYAAGASEVR